MYPIVCYQLIVQIEEGKPFSEMRFSPCVSQSPVSARQFSKNSPTCGSFPSQASSRRTYPRSSGRKATPIWRSWKASEERYSTRRGSEDPSERDFGRGHTAGSYPVRSPRSPSSLGRLRTRVLRESQEDTRPSDNKARLTAGISSSPSSSPRSSCASALSPGRDKDTSIIRYPKQMRSFADR